MPSFWLGQRQKKQSPRRKTLTKARDSASVSASADSGRLRPGRGGSDSSWSWLLSSDYQLDLPAPQTGGQSVTLSVSLPPVSHATWAWGCVCLTLPLLMRLYFFCVCSYVHRWFVVHKHYLMFVCEHVQYCKKSYQRMIYGENNVPVVMDVLLYMRRNCHLPENCSSQQSSLRTSPPAGGDFIF